jgi:hypothetical protein
VCEGVCVVCIVCIQHTLMGRMLCAKVWVCQIPAACATGT